MQLTGWRALLLTFCGLVVGLCWSIPMAFAGGPTPSPATPVPAASAASPSTDSLFQYVKLVVDTLTSPQVVLAALIGIIMRKEPKILERITKFSGGGISVELEKIDAQFVETTKKIDETRKEVNETRKEVVGIAGKLDALQQNYLEQAEQIDVSSSAEDLDAVATKMKRTAASLSNIDFVLGNFHLGEEPTLVFGAAVAVGVRPESKFFKPIAAYIDSIAGPPDLDGLRLKIVYRLVMSIESICRADNARADHTISSEDRQQAVGALEHLARHERCVADDVAHGTRGIGARIKRTIKVVGS